MSNCLTPFTRNFSDTSINTNKKYANLNNANELKIAFGNVLVNAAWAQFIKVDRKWTSLPERSSSKIHKIH